MRPIFRTLFLSLFLVLSGCIDAEVNDYVPSIAALVPNETLVMKLRACHWECTKGTVKFKNGVVTFGKNSLRLTAEEVSDLEAYFLLGTKIEEGGRCSLPIKIGFKKKTGLVTSASKETLIYPCAFGDEQTIDPLLLVVHLKETPQDIPYWRLSTEEQSKVHVLIEG